MTTLLAKRVAIVTLIFGVGSCGVIGTIFPGTLPDFLTTISATLVSAALAVAGTVWVIAKRDDEDHDRLQMQLALEARLNLKTLGERYGTMMDAKTLDELGQVVPIPLPIAALDELISSGFEDPNVVSGLISFAAHLRMHNIQVNALLGARQGGSSAVSIRFLILELNQRQDLIREGLEELLQRLKAVGKEPPPLATPPKGHQFDPFMSAQEARDWIEKNR